MITPKSGLENGGSTSPVYMFLTNIARQTTVIFAATRSHRLQRHDESKGWKWKISTIYLQQEYAYSLQETHLRAAMIHLDLAYYMILNTETQDYSLSSLLLHNLTDSNRSDLVENEKPKSSHKNCNMSTSVPRGSGTLSPQLTMAI
jgi:hypothetical protein